MRRCAVGQFGTSSRNKVYRNNPFHPGTWWNPLHQQCPPSLRLISESSTQAFRWACLILSLHGTSMMLMLALHSPELMYSGTSSVIISLDAGMNPCTTYYRSSDMHSASNPFRCASMARSPTCGGSAVAPKHLLFHKLCSSYSDCGPTLGQAGSRSSFVMYMQYNPYASTCGFSTVAYAAYCSKDDLGRCAAPAHTGRIQNYAFRWPAHLKSATAVDCHKHPILCHFSVVCNYKLQAMPMAKAWECKMGRIV